MQPNNTEVKPVDELPHEDEAHDTWPVKEPPSFSTTPPPEGVVIQFPNLKAPRAPDFSNDED